MRDRHSSCLVFGRSTGNDASGHYKHHYFLVFSPRFFSLSPTFLTEGMLGSKNVFSKSWREHQKPRETSLEWVPPSQLGWYWIAFSVMTKSHQGGGWGLCMPIGLLVFQNFPLLFYCWLQFSPVVQVINSLRTRQCLRTFTGHLFTLLGCHISLWFKQSNFWTMFSLKVRKFGKTFS